MFQETGAVGEAGSGSQRPDSGLSGSLSSGGSTAVDSGVSPGSGPPDLGSSCDTDEDCESEFCSDGVCCDERCDGQCEACDVDDEVGRCSQVSGEPHGDRSECEGLGSCQAACSNDRDECTFPTSVCRLESCEDGEYTEQAECDGEGACPAGVATSCGLYACDVAGERCLRSCADSGDCAPGAYCDEGDCVEGRGDGESCADDEQCSSTHCADGVCCESSCGGQCEACDVSGSVGECRQVSGAPHGSRDACAGTGTCAGTCSTDPSECDYPTSTCATESCAGGMYTPPGTCDGAGTCSSTIVACHPYVCDLSGVACTTDCTGDVDCADDAYCMDDACIAKKPLGDECDADIECESDTCVDGVCCDVPCTGQCEACDVDGSVGSCTTLTAGQPHGTRTACAGSGACQGACVDEGSPDACRYSTGTCGVQSCSGGILVRASSCDGAGACVPGGSETCPGNYACDDAGTDCRTTCSGDAHCGPSAPYCVGGSCVAGKPNSEPCGGGGECASGACVDGVCCNSSCTGQCQACDLTGSVGTCSTVTSGQPRGTRAACAGSAPCRGSCTGASTSCTYPTSSTVCTAQTCSGGVVTPASTCNGAGSCTSPSTQSCGNFACNGNTCHTSCSSNTQCAATLFCELGTGQCVVTCFVAGTPVETADGPRAIETLEPGDRVRTFDELTGESRYAAVTAVEQRFARALVRAMPSSGEPIVMSPEHQLWVLGSGWVRAAELAPGDVLQGVGDEAVSIEGLESIALDEAGGDASDDAEVAVYNVLVEGSPTYFVGEPAVLVHSCDFLNFSSLPASHAPTQGSD